MVSRWHPLVLHLPVALYVILFLLEFPSLLRRRAPPPDTTRRLLVRLLVLTAPLAAVSGWLLHEGGGYGDEVDWHEWLGIALAAVSVWVGFTYRWQPERYPLAVFLGFALMVPTAHLGGSLTHGEEFLTGPWMSAETEVGDGDTTEPPADNTTDNAAGDPASKTAGDAASPASDVLAASTTPAALTTVQADFTTVQPVFLARCGKCHGERKQRGGLSFATQALALQGGDSGPALVPGQPEASLLMERLLLPLEHDDHMPPSTKSQPTDTEQAAIADWIAGLTPGAVQDEVPSAPAIAPAIAPADVQAPASPAKEQPTTPTSPAQAQPATPDTSAVPDEASELASTAVAADALGDESVLSVDSVLAANDGMDALIARLVHVERLSVDQPWLWLDFEAATLKPGDLAELLQPVREFVVQLSLGGKLVGDNEIELLATLPKLERLDLRRLKGPPLNLAPLANHSALSWLNLSATTLAPGSSDVLQHMTPLTTVYLWNTGLTAAQQDELAAARPTLIVYGAAAPSDSAIEVEPPVVFTEGDA